FFFSSRRRHTRFSRDWSSDVCSSDLAITESAYPATESPVSVDAKSSRQAIVARAATLPATKKRPYLPKRIAPLLQTSCHAYPAFRARPIRPATRVAGPSALRNVQIRHRSRGDLGGERDR